MSAHPCVIILARTYRSAADYARHVGLSPREWRYPMRPSDVCGVNLSPGITRVVLLPGFYDRQGWSEIYAELQMRAPVFGASDWLEEVEG